ncbi:MAG: hypothetical protein V3V08_02475 [Nannocystaceae bacterium]
MPMSFAGRFTLAAVLLLIPTASTYAWVGSAAKRLEIATARANEHPHADTQVATAAPADEAYCNAGLRKVLQRVLKSCGLLGSGEVRGCQPADAKSVATMAGPDFNALFAPVAGRAGIVQFEKNTSQLDARDRTLLDGVFADQRGASYFLVVARASPEGSVQHNRALSQDRAQAVLSHLRETFQDPDLDREVGLLWLGEEFAQLDTDFCRWNRSGDPSACETADLNRSAFAAWIDCQL